MHNSIRFLSLILVSSVLQAATNQALPKPSPLDGIDLDQLQPGEADSTTN